MTKTRLVRPSTDSLACTCPLRSNGPRQAISIVDACRTSRNVACHHAEGEVNCGSKKISAPYSNEFYRRASPGCPDEDVWAYVCCAEMGIMQGYFFTLPARPDNTLPSPPRSDQVWPLGLR